MRRSLLAYAFAVTLRYAPNLRNHISMMLASNAVFTRFGRELIPPFSGSELRVSPYTANRDIIASQLVALATWLLCYKPRPMQDATG
jgi:hypothetical protein